MLTHHYLVELIIRLFLSFTVLLLPFILFSLRFFFFRVKREETTARLDCDEEAKSRPIAGVISRPLFFLRFDGNVRSRQTVSMRVYTRFFSHGTSSTSDNQLRASFFFPRCLELVTRSGAEVLPRRNVALFFFPLRDYEDILMSRRYCSGVYHPLNGVNRF